MEEILSKYITVDDKTKALIRSNQTKTNHGKKKKNTTPPENEFKFLPNAKLLKDEIYSILNLQLDLFDENSLLRDHKNPPTSKSVQNNNNTDKDRDSMDVDSSKPKTNRNGNAGSIKQESTPSKKIKLDPSVTTATPTAAAAATPTTTRNKTTNNDVQNKNISNTHASTPSTPTKSTKTANIQTPGNNASTTSIVSVGNTPAGDSGEVNTSTEFFDLLERYRLYKSTANKDYLKSFEVNFLKRESIKYRLPTTEDSQNILQFYQICPQKQRKEIPASEHEKNILTFQTYLSLVSKATPSSDTETSKNSNTQVSSDELFQFLSEKYFWLGMRSDCDNLVYNYTSNLPSYHKLLETNNTSVK